MPDPMMSPNPNPSMLCFEEKVATVLVVVSGMERHNAHTKDRNCLERLVR